MVSKSLQWTLQTLTAGLWLSIFSGAPAQAVGVSFTQVASTSSSFSSLGSNASINNAGTIVFQGSLSSGGNGIFTGDGGTLTTIATTGSSFSSFGNTASINSAGTVAFSANSATGQGVFTGGGGALTPIADNSGTFLFFNTSPAINDSGTVAFGALFGIANTGIFAGNGGVLTTIATDSGPFAGFSNTVAINNSGTVAFRALLDAGVNGEGIFSVNGGATTTIVDNLNGAFSSFGNPSLSSVGSTSFLATTSTGAGVYSVSGGALVTIADNFSANTPFQGFVGGNGTAINSLGTVAFRANLRGGGGGIFVGSDPLTDSVIRIGDALFGSTVTNLQLGSQSLNDNNQLTFLATLADGRQVLTRADIPNTQTVPEPASLVGMAALGLWGTFAARKKK
ncbi:DUF7453 family protein [Anthocerotibacter panamensis]|uniref:DUF7453 family protein n=1 Tax=Anthocerotibacter panamensis TaxID=2857077 RepID=UPI001C406939|nr:choice-of-anchor tandem repeat NxxGxxAF-containing protein [Anthocerotibacter panamensis]